MSTVDSVTGYYNRWRSDGAGSSESAKDYDEHLIRAGYIGQSAEINEIQSRFKARLADLGNHLLKDGDFKLGGNLVIGGLVGQGQTVPNKVSALAEVSEVWLAGAVRRVPERLLFVPDTGMQQVGIWLTESVVDETDDATLRDPAIGLRPFGEPGAARLKVSCEWGLSTENHTGSFYAIHRVLNGVPLLRREPPEANAVAQAVSRYDRQSTGGSYVSSGFRVTMVPDSTEESQIYSLSSGIARVNGSEVIADHAQTLVYNTTADVDTIEEEQYDSTGLQGQVVTVRHAPIATVNRVAVVKAVTAAVVTRSSLGNTDLLANTSIVAVSEVKQGGTTYVAGVNYSLSNDSILWLSGGPSPGSTYTVTYTYTKNVTSTATLTADKTGIIIPEVNVSGANQIEVGYDYKLPRIDRVCMDAEGQWHIVKGVSARRQAPLFPQIPFGYLGLASIYQTWVAGTRTVTNDALRMVSMAKLENHDKDIATLFELVANNNLASDLSAREPLGRRGLFVDSFQSNNARDAGTEQSAQITQAQTLTLGTQGVEYPISLDNPITLVPTGEIVRVEQLLSSDTMQINPYLAYAPPITYAYLNPWWDFWTVSVQSVLPPQYIDVYTYTTTQVNNSSTMATADESLWNTSQTTTQTQTTTNLVSDTSETTVSARTEDAKYMRAVDVRFTLTNWGSNENLVDVKIDGRSITFEGL